MSKITILQTTDVHGYIYPHDYINEKNWGLLKASTLINKHRDENTILIDSGDATQGSPLAYYLYKKANYEQHPIINLMNTMQYDVFTFGNHEFNYGLEYLSKTLKDFNGEILSANIKGIDNFVDSKPYTIIEKAGVKIAIIGLTTQYIPNWEEAKNIKGLDFLCPVKQYKKYEKELQEKADLIVVNYHGGMECDLDDLNLATEKITGENQACEMLREIKSIDVLLTGHQHREIAKKINNTVTVQPANNAQFVSKIEIDVKQKEITSFEVLSVDETVNIDENLEKIINPFEQETQAYLDQVIGKADQEMKITDMFKARQQGHPLTNFINQLQIEKSGAEISAVSIFDSAIGFGKTITIRDIIANYPYPNTLKVIEITKQDLIAALEVCASYFEVINDELVIGDKFIKPKLQNYQYDLFYGINYEIDARRSAEEKITKVTINGKELEDKNYSLIVNNYRASNISWYPMYENKKELKDINIDMVELLTNYILEKETITIDETKNIKVIY